MVPPLRKRCPPLREGGRFGETGRGSKQRATSNEQRTTATSNDRESTMQRQPLAARHRDRIAAGLPFVESLARRVAASMPHSIELGDLVQDGMLGLIDAACRFDEG